MKITDLKSYIVTTPAEGIGSVTWVFVRLDTDEGLSGWGEAGGATAPDTAQSVVAALQALKTFLIGQKTTNIERIWHNIYHRYTYFGSRGFGTAVAAGVDIALWDLNGKATGRPIYDLLGGQFRETIPLYSNVWFDSACTTAEDYARNGKPGLGYDLDEDWLAAHAI
jgi:galactonate dehydratase